MGSGELLTPCPRGKLCRAGCCWSEKKKKTGEAEKMWTFPLTESINILLWRSQHPCLKHVEKGCFQHIGVYRPQS